MRGKEEIVEVGNLALGEIIKDLNSLVLPHRLKSTLLFEYFIYDFLFLGVLIELLLLWLIGLARSL